MAHVVWKWFPALCSCCSAVCLVLHRVLGVRHGRPAVKVTERSVRVWPLRPPRRWPPHMWPIGVFKRWKIKTNRTVFRSVYRCHSPRVSRCLPFFVSALSSVVPKTACRKKKDSLSVKLEASSHTINIHRRKSICKVSFSLTTCSHSRWSIGASLAANLTAALFQSLDWWLRSWPQSVTYEALRCPLAGPALAPDAAEHRGAAVNSPDKRLSAPRSPLMSPTKRTESTLGPLGFYLPFSLWPPQRVDWGVKFVRCLSCDRLTTSHTAFEIPKELHVAFSRFMLSVFIFSLRHWSVMFAGRSCQDWTSLGTT